MPQQSLFLTESAPAASEWRPLTGRGPKSADSSGTGYEKCDWAVDGPSCEPTRRPGRGLKEQSRFLGPWDAVAGLRA